MRIIEKSTGKQIDFLEKINKSTWRKWIWVAVVFLLLLVGIFLIILFPLVFSHYDFIFIGLFLVVATYYLIQVQRIK